MRRTLSVAWLVVITACSSAGDLEVATTSLAPTTAVSAAPTSAPAATTLPPGTTSTIPPPSTTTTTVTEVAEGVCAFYIDFTRAGVESDASVSLRALSVALGFPRDPGISAALDVLRGRSTERSGPAARAVLDEAFGSCPPAGSADAGLDYFMDAAVMVGGPGGVALLDGTPIVAPDPTGTFFAAFDDWRGGIFAMVEIQGLEIVDHRSDTAATPRDLVLAEDARLHDSARIDGVEVGIVTIWEPAADFGDLAQHLYLVPFDGRDLIRVGTVGDLVAGAETVSYSAGRYLITESRLGGPTTIYALDRSGQRLETAPGLPIVAGPLDDAGLPALRFARFAPDGESFAYLRARPSAGTGEVRTEVVVQRTGDGVEVASIDIGGPADLHSSLDFDGRHVLVATGDRLIVFDLQAGPSGELSTIPVSDAEFAFFLDSGLALPGDD